MENYDLNTGFYWGKSSKEELETTHEDMQLLATVALEKYSTVDVAVLQGLRTAQEQAENVRKGKSISKNSMHLARVPVDQPDAEPCSYAIDIQTYMNTPDGVHRTWEIPYYYGWAEAMRLASVATKIDVTWGGCWMNLRHVVSIHHAVEAYKKRVRIRNKRTGSKRGPLLDFGHFELNRRTYKTKVV